MKWYYLVQFAFWLQQIVVVNIEEHRKDYAQMFSHHVITCTLIFTSYGYHQSKVGNVILCIMDLADIILPFAKILKYFKFGLICDVTFGVFIITWFVPRHLFYNSVCWSIWAQVPRVMNYGCYRGSSTSLQGPLPIPNDWDHLIQPFYDPEGLICMNDRIRLVFLGMLLLLQVVLMLWFATIVRIAWTVLNGGKAEDTRSDDEEEELEVEGIKGPDTKGFKVKEDYIEVEDPLIEQEVWAEDMNFNPQAKGFTIQKNSRSTSARRSTRRGEGHSAATTAVNFRASAGDRKELLGRIGCDHKSS